LLRDQLRDVILSEAKDPLCSFSERYSRCFAEFTLSELQRFFAEFTLSPFAVLRAVRKRKGERAQNDGERAQHDGWRSSRD